jgi:hypothetical protein
MYCQTIRDKKIINWKGYGRKWQWPNLRYYPDIFLEGLRKTMKISVRRDSLWAEI